VACKKDETYHICKIVGTITNIKQRRGIFWTQLRRLIQDIKFEDKLSEVEKAKWKSLKNITTNFWGEKSKGINLSLYGG
jgi:hypothetical protein